MDPTEITTIITSVITGIARVVGITRESLTKSLEDMARDARSGKLIPDELLEKVKSDGARMDGIRDSLPD